MAQVSYGTITITDVQDIGSVINYYLATDLSSDVTTDDPTGHGAWTTNIEQATLSESAPYLWNYEEIKDSAGQTISTTSPIIIGNYSQDGEPGRGISSIDEYYKITDSPTKTNSNPGSTGWSNPNQFVAPTSEYRYLWNYQVVNYTSGSPSGSYEDARIIGVYGDRGAAGVNSATIYLYKRTAATNVSAPAIDTYTYYFANGSISPTPTDNWSTSIPSGTDPVWVTTTTLRSTNSSELITSWTNPVKLVSNGTDGVGIDSVEALYYLKTQTLYTVTYTYGNTVSGAPALPATTTHIAGETIAVASAPSLSGYTFSGWTTSNATVINGSFTMPETDVTFTGSWTSNAQPTYAVTYSYTSTPTGAPALPTTTSYTAGTQVSVAATPTLNNYTFSGWTTTDVTVSDGSFTMPATAVAFTGTWIPTSSGSGVTVATATKTLTQANSQIQFTGLNGEPTSFAICSAADLATGASPWKTAIVAYNGTNIYGSYITNTNGQQMTASSSAFSKTYSNGTLTITGSGTSFQANQYKLVYTYGGSTSDIKTVTQTVGSGVTSITFTGLTGQPAYFSCLFEGGYYDAVNSSWGGGYQRVIGVVYDGTSTYGMAMGANAVASTSYWTYTYNNGSLTITSQGTNSGGYFHQASGVDYRLTYVVAPSRGVVSDNNTKGVINNEEEPEVDDSKDEKEEIVLTKGAVLRAGSNDASNYPAKPSQLITNTNDETDNWTLTVPTYVQGGTYYTCLQIIYTDGNFDWSDVQLDEGLTSANENAWQANETATAVSNQFIPVKAAVDLLGGAFYKLENSSRPNTTPDGAGVVQGLLDTNGLAKSPTEWEYNVWVSANGIELRKAETVFSRWAVDSANNNVASIQLGRDNAERFVISNNKLEAYNNSGLNGIKYFEVSSTGIKYGDFSNNNFNTVASQSDIDNISVGGRNILRDTKHYDNWTFSDSENSGNGTQYQSVIISEEGVPTYTLEFPDTTSEVIYEYVFSKPRFEYSHIRDKHVIFSADIKAENGITTGILIGYSIYAEQEEGTRLLYTNSAIEITGTGNWETITQERDISDSVFTLGEGAVDFDDCYIRFEIWKVFNQGYTAGFQLKNLKLEVGNKATAWSPAPEDTEDIFENFEESFRKIDSHFESIEDKFTTNIYTQDEVDDKIKAVEDTIDEAANTANYYISPITNGTSFHKANNSTTDLQITDDIIIRRNGIPRIVIDTNGMTIYSFDQNNSEVYPVAVYSSTTSIGRQNAHHVEIAGTQLTFYDKNSKIAWLENGQLHVLQSNAETEISIGTPHSEKDINKEDGQGKWIWKIHTNAEGKNNLGLLWSY